MRPDALQHRSGLPEHLRFLLAEHPRKRWLAPDHFDDLTRFWLDRHRMFRDLVTRIGGETRDFLDGGTEARTFAQRSSRLTGFFLQQLHGHHTIEDQHYFPLLAAHDPRLPEGFDLLGRDHAALDVQIATLAETTNDMLRALTRGGGHDEAGRTESVLAAFKPFLTRHLDDEEDLVVPVILEYGSPDL